MAFATRHADYGQRWGEGAARCFSIEGDFLDDAQGPRLMPVPDSFFCPISAAVMNDPVATVDGCAYEREYIERWFRERRQFRQPITSPTTGLELQSTTLMPLVALQRAIEAYLLHRPELKRDHLTGRSFEEAAQVLQIDLLEKQAMNASVHDELRRLREANRALRRALKETEDACSKVMQELERTRIHVRELEDEKAASSGMRDNVRASGHAVAASDAAGPSRESSSSSKPVASSSRGAASSSGHRIEQKKPSVSFDERTSPPMQAASSRELPRTGSGSSSSRAEPSSASRAKPGERGAKQPPPLHPAVSAHVQDVRESKGNGWANFHVSGRTQQFLQGALLAALLALCLLLHVRNPWPEDGLKTSGAKTGSNILSPLPVPLHVRTSKASLDGKALQGRAEWDAISRNIEQLQSSGAHERARAAQTLRQLVAEGGDVEEAIVRDGATEPLVKLLEDDGPRVQEAGAAALGALAASGAESQVAVARAGAIPHLVHLLQASDLGAAPRAAASALRHLAAGSEKNQAAIARAGAIAPLVDMLRSDVPAARLEAVGALRQLAGEGSEESRYGKQVAIVQAGAIVPLVRCARDEDPAARQASVGTLRMLATNNADNQVAIAQAGAIGPLVDLLADAEPGVRREAAAALDHLAVFEAEAAFGGQAARRGETNFGNQAAIGQAGAIKQLAKLLQDEAPDVRLAAAGALRSLAASNADNQRKIVQAGCLPGIVALLHGDIISVAAIALLGNLASGDRGSQILISQMGAIAPLVQLLRHEAQQVRGEAAGTLLSLAKDNLDIQAAINQAGVSSDLLKGERF